MSSDCEAGTTPRLAWPITGLFLVVCVATALIDQLHPAPLPDLIGAERVAFERSAARAKLSDGSLARHYEEHLRLTSRVRRTFTPRYAWWLYRHLGIVRPVTLLGSDDWLYLRSRALPVDAPPDAPKIAASALAAMERMLSMNGIDLTVAAIPRKSVAHPEHLPPGVDHRPELDEELMRELARRGVNAPDLLKLFRASKSQDLYHRVGTHWTQYAQAITAQAIARAAKIIVPQKRRLGYFQQQGLSPADRDLIAFLGIAIDEVTMAFLAEHPLDAWNIYGAGRKPYDFARVPESSRIALAGTSFSAGRKLPRYLSHFAGTRIQNGAKQGGDPTNGIAEFLRGSPRPESILLEVPNHSLLSARPLPQLGRIFSALQAEHYTVLQGPEHQPIKASYKALAQGPTPGSFFTAHPTPLIHSADGILAWHISGETTGVGATIQASGPLPMDLPWPSGQTDLFIPIIGQDSLPTPMTLTIRTNPHPKNPGKIRIDAIELVALFAPTPIATGTPNKPHSANNRWSQSVEFSLADPLPGHAGLLITLDASAPTETLLDLELRTGNKQTPPLNFQSLRVQPNGRILINLSAFAGERLETLRITGNNSSTANPQITRAEVHPLRE